MAWTWRFENTEGTQVTPVVEPEDFPTQGDAETWVGEHWQQLRDGGVDQLVLLDDGAVVYGPMSLHEA